jgi:hypothetical protein
MASRRSREKPDAARTRGCAYQHLACPAKPSNQERLVVRPVLFALLVFYRCNRG